MNYREIDFDRIAEETRLDPKSGAHFVEGMKQGAEQLPLGREEYTTLQAILEREVLGATDLNEVPRVDAERPFAYATPNPLTPLYTQGHPRHRIAGIMFRRLMGVSVMGDASFRSTIDENMRAGREVSVTAGRAFQHDANLFSTTLNIEDVQPPRMTMHFEGANGPIRVAFLAEQLPSQTAGRLVFGDEATAMYRSVQELHQQNVREGRGAEYVYQTITGQELKKY